MQTRETDRLFLRPPIAEDLDPWIEIHEDPDVLRYLISATPSVGRVGAWRMIAMMIGHWHIRGYGQWTVIEKATNQIIGRVGLWYPEGWPDLEVGWVIRKSRWGHGFATEAAREAIDVAFGHVGADHVISVIRPDNLPSIRVAQKLGEAKERSIMTDGVMSDIYGITRPRNYKPGPIRSQIAAGAR
jgi:RimJ/RimL family protein N-acetyltransferase